jgi:uroporphyrinogen-III synthase
MNARPPAPPWTLLSLRPRGQHAGLRRAAARQGARVLAVSPLAIEARDDADVRAARASAETADLWVFTSPNAVRAAQALQPLQLRRDQIALGVGAGTRRALARLGIAADAPARMDSEGLLAMPALQDVAGRRIALFTAPGGRGRLAPELQARGATVARIDVYTRAQVAIPHPRWEALRQALHAPAPVVLALSSGEALHALLAQVPAALAGEVRALPVVAASARLAGIARDAGFARIAIADDARPATLAQVARAAFV